MARTISVKLERQDERQALAEMALRQYRTPADQAAWLILQGLRQAGFLRDEPQPVEAGR